jgi:NAD(P)-dependent dehydrogenase (short-subunit alcohol dehydrogenase family)
VVSVAAPPRRLTDAVAIVTGSTRGIGAATAHRLAREGADVVVSGRSEGAGRAVVTAIDDGHSDVEARFIAADMREPTAIDELIDETEDELGGVDILVNNAAYQTATTVRETDLSTWTDVIDTNLRGYWLAARAAAAAMAGDGVIVNVSSNHAMLSMPETFPYNVTKAAIDGLTRAMALELGTDGIRVNGVNPGWIAVGRTEEELSDGRRAAIADAHPLGQIGQPEDVAGVIAFLCSADARFMTGASVVVDGGRSIVMDDAVQRDWAASSTDDPS